MSKESFNNFYSFLKEHPHREDYADGVERELSFVWRGSICDDMNSKNACSQLLAGVEEGCGCISDYEDMEQAQDDLAKKAFSYLDNLDPIQRQGMAVQIRQNLSRIYTGKEADADSLALAAQEGDPQKLLIDSLDYRLLFPDKLENPCDDAEQLRTLKKSAASLTDKVMTGVASAASFWMEEDRDLSDRNYTAEEYAAWMGVYILKNVGDDREKALILEDPAFIKLVGVSTGMMCEAFHKACTSYEVHADVDAAEKLLLAVTIVAAAALFLAAMGGLVYLVGISAIPLSEDAAIAVSGLVPIAAFASIGVAGCTAYQWLDQKFVGRYFRRLSRKNAEETVAEAREQGTCIRTSAAETEERLVMQGV